MSQSHLINSTKVLLSYFVLTLFISCSASNHAGVTNVKEPPENTSDERTWFTYYQDQFDAFDGNVLSPPDNYPKVARQGYQRASADWNDKVSLARTNSILLIVGGSIFIPIIILAAAIP